MWRKTQTDGSFLLQHGVGPSRDKRREEIIAMVLVKTPYGNFHQPPYTEEENQEFEQRLRRGSDITIVNGSKSKAGRKKQRGSEKYKSS